jgi:hypothetical protein
MFSMLAAGIKRLSAWTLGVKQVFRTQASSRDTDDHRPRKKEGLTCLKA